MKEIKLSNSWKYQLKFEFKLPYFLKLKKFIKKEYQKNICYPNIKEIFSCFNYCSFEQTKVIIIGQDPYQKNNQANGFCFSVRKGIIFPPSLRNIFKEIKNDLGKSFPLNGDLTRWAQQGVLLLNSILTVRSGYSKSHQNKGWEIFTNKVVSKLSKEKKNLVFLLWGNFSKKKKIFINNTSHLVLSSSHPSPFSAYNGFFGCNHFSKTNIFLLKKNILPINW